LTHYKKIAFIFLILTAFLSYSAVADQMPRDFLIEVAKGNVPGHEIVHLVIHSEIVDTDEDVVWCVDDDYAFLTSATTLNVTSTDVDDVMADTGAWNVTIYGLDINFAPITEVVNLNGQTPVSTTSSFYRVNSIHTNTAGSSETNEGTIYVGTGATVAGVPTNIYGVICAGEGWSNMGIYSVKADYSAYMIEGILGTDDDKVVNFGVYYRGNAKVSRTWKLVEHIHIHRGFVSTSYYYSSLPDRADIRLDASVAVGEASVSGLLAVLLVDDDVLTNSTLNWDSGDASETSINSDTENTLLYIVIAILFMGMIGAGLLSRRR